MAPRVFEESENIEEKAWVYYFVCAFWLVEAVTLLSSWGLYVVIFAANTRKANWGPADWLSLVYFVSYS